MFDSAGDGESADALALPVPFTVPDRESLAVLESFTPFLEPSSDCRLSDLGMLDVIAGWSRQAAHAEAMVRQWAAALASSPSMEPLWRSETGAVLDAGADEIAMRLAIGRRSALSLVREGQALRGVLHPVGEAFSAGLIDARRARVFVDELEDHSPAVILAVIDQVLPVAPNLTPPQVRARIRGVIVQVDPEQAGEREQLAVTKRRVNLPQPVGDGMAFFSAVLPAVEAMTLYHVCEATARAGRADGDHRTLDQLRADTLTSLAERALAEGCVLPATDVRLTPMESALNVGGKVDGRSGVSSTISTPHLNLEVAIEDTSRGLDAEAATTVSEPAASPFAVGYRFSGRTAQVHITLPEAMLHPETSIEPRITPAAIYEAEIAGDDAFLDHAETLGYTAPTHCTPGVDVPDLAGYGPIAPATVQTLITGPEPLPPWLKINPPVDPDDPPPPTTSYRPTAELDRYIRRRDRHCQAPTCTTPAESGDIDHITPWPQGETSAPNLHALCRRHHQQKTHGGHTITKNPDGTITWTTRAGQTLTQHPNGHITRSQTSRPET